MVISVIFLTRSLYTRRARIFMYIFTCGLYSRTVCANCQLDVCLKRQQLLEYSIYLEHCLQYVSVICWNC